jgi:hypothetical protein
MYWGHYVHDISMDTKFPYLHYGLFVYYTIYDYFMVMLKTCNVVVYHIVVVCVLVVVIIDYMCTSGGHH